MEDEHGREPLVYNGKYQIQSLWLKTNDQHEGLDPLWLTASF